MATEELRGDMERTSDAAHVFVYQFRPSLSDAPERGEIVAANEDEARRKLRIQCALPRLPLGTRIIPKADLERREAGVRSAKLRQVLRVLSAHHAWLHNAHGGERADLSGLSLSHVNLAGKALNHADMAEAMLAGADLSGTCLIGANLVRADLSGADLRKADLRMADLSEADLREANLVGAKLDGADLWRANLRGCMISPKALHAALACKAR
ncbi:MAG: pentapeptide repeat-containing protein [Proteobacteria bacterium]|nr:pentapeptide repeat-containing protein [Pseudomonadota bacterium]